MRKALLVLLPVAILVLIAFALQAQDAAAPKWLDPAGCYFCQPLTQTEGLMDHLTWENHNIKNGIVQVTTVPTEWKDKYKAACTEMEKRWGSFDPKNPQPLCGMCQAWQKVPKDKVTWEWVYFSGGEIGIGTATDSTVIAQLHEISDKTCNAMDEMMKAGAPKQ
jgi:hypothetical protein